MKQYKLVVTKKGSSPTKTPVHEKVVDQVLKFTIELPKAPGTNGKELLLPKQNYKDATSRLVPLLTDNALAGDVVTILEGIESEHTAIIFQQM